MISLRGLFKSSIIYGIGSAVLRIMTFVLLPIYTYEEVIVIEGVKTFVPRIPYGDYGVILATIAILRACYSHGTGDSFLKLYGQADSKNKKNIISTYILYILAIIAIASGLLLILNSVIGPQNETSLTGLLQKYLPHILLIVVCDTLNYRVIDILRIKNYALYYMVGQIAGVICTLYLATHYVIDANMGLEGALLALLGGTFVTLIIFSPILIQNINLPDFSMPDLKSMLQLGVYFFPATLFFIAMTALDKYLLFWLLEGSSEWKDSVIGTYFAGAKFASVPMLMISAFNLGWQPFYLTNGATEEALKKYQKIGTIFTISVLGVVWFVGIIMPMIAKSNIPFTDTPFVGNTYSGFENVLPILLISHVFYALYIINMPAIYLHNKQKWSPIFRMFGAVINIILNIILIPIYGIEGAAIATAVSYGLMFLFLFYKNQTWLPIKLAWNDIILLTLVISISIISFMYNMQGQYYIMGLVLLYICFLLYKHGIKNLVSLFK